MICDKCGAWHERLTKRCKDCVQATIDSINESLRKIHAKIKAGVPLKGKPREPAR